MGGKHCQELEKSIADGPHHGTGNYSRLGQRPILRDKLVEVWNFPWAIELSVRQPPNISLTSLRLRSVLASPHAGAVDRRQPADYWESQMPGRTAGIKVDRHAPAMCAA